MNLDDITTEASRRLKDKTQKTWIVEDLKVWAEDGNRETCILMECITGQATATLPTLGQSAYDFSDSTTGFNKTDILYVKRISHNGSPLERETEDSMDEKYSDWRSASNGTPQRYFQDGLKGIVINPPHDATAITKTLKIERYIKIPRKMSDVSGKYPFDGQASLYTHYYEPIILYVCWQACKRETIVPTTEKYSLFKLLADQFMREFYAKCGEYKAKIEKIGDKYGDQIGGLRPIVNARRI